MGVEEDSPGELADIDTISTRQDALETDIGTMPLRKQRVVEGGCSCRQLFRTTSSNCSKRKARLKQANLKKEGKGQAF